MRGVSIAQPTEIKKKMRRAVCYALRWSASSFKRRIGRDTFYGHAFSPMPLVHCKTSTTHVNVRVDNDARLLSSFNARDISCAELARLECLGIDVMCESGTFLKGCERPRRCGGSCDATVGCRAC